MAAILRTEARAPSSAAPSPKLPNRRRRARPAHPPEALELAVRDLLQPGALRITVEPLRRLYDGAVLAYEVRWRVPRVDVMPSISEIWEAAKAADLLNTLDDTLLRAELEVARRLSPGAVLLEMHPWRRPRRGLLTGLMREVRAAGLTPTQIVWQMVDQDDERDRLDRGPIYDLADQLHDRGFRVGMAQLGTVRTRLMEIGKVAPDILQMDQVLIDGIDSNRGQRAVVSALVAFASQMDAYLTAGGITEESEKAVMLELGVQFGQGPLLGEALVALGEGADAFELPSRPLLLSLHDKQAVSLLVGPAEPTAAGSLKRPRTTAVDSYHLGIAEILSQAARAFQTENDAESILELAADYLERVVPFDGLSVYEADWDSGRFRPVLARSSTDATYVPAVMAHSFPLGTGLTGWAFDIGSPQRVNDADAHPAAGHVPGTENDPQNQDESMLLIPLVFGDYRLGMLNMVRNRKDGYLPYDLTVASLVAHMAAAAWRNVQLYAEQVQHAITDSLTNLLNTRWLRDAARRELAMAERSGTPMAILMIDLDHFKYINDSCGHAVGDGILRNVGRTLLRSIRAEDAAVRYGGEEFVLILRGCTLDGARRIAREIRTGLAAIPLPEESTVPQVTASVGIALFPKHGRTIGQLLGVADAAMYSAKRRGRDRVAVGH
ncbi:MAG TPA: diguanylate cyclase [Candidatus Saccharimonadales bacterium]|nr:diguanylate cyclase [Candidatus Saccharimonadales bacterium]